MSLGGFILGIIFRIGVLLYIRKWLRSSRLVVVLVAEDGENPSTHCLPVDSLCFPGTIGLLGAGLETRRLALVWLAAAIADQVAPDYFTALLILAASLVAVGARLDDLVAIIGHARLELRE
jgi:hypothetical protein